MTESTDLTNNILCIEPGEKMQVKSTFLTDFFLFETSSSIIVILVWEEIHPKNASVTQRLDKAFKRGMGPLDKSGEF